MEIFEVYDAIGVSRNNIVCLEQRREVCNELKRRGLGVVIKCQSLEQFIGSSRASKFDIVSLDFMGQLGTYENQIYRLKKRGFLDDNAVVFTNFCGARESDASKGYYYLARQRAASPITVMDIADIMERSRKARYSKAAIKQILSEYDSEPVARFWEERVTEQRSAGIHETVRGSLTRGSLGIVDVLFREKDHDGCMTEEVRKFYDARSLRSRDVSPEMASVIRMGLEAASRKDDALPCMMLVVLWKEAEERVRKLVRAFARKFAKQSGHLAMNVDIVAKLLLNAIETCMGSPFLVVATESYKYVSDKGMPMYADVFHIRRLHECDFLAELLPTQAGCVADLLRTIAKLSLSDFVRLVETLAEKAVALAEAESAQPAVPERIDLGRERQLNPPRRSIEPDVSSVRERALALLTAGPYLTVEDVAVTLGARRMQVAAWKAHITMGTYVNDGTSALRDAVDDAFETGRYSEALELSARLLRCEPKSVRLLNNRAVILSCLGRGRQALAVIEKAISFSPGDPMLLFTKAAQLEQLGRFTEAAHTYEEVASIHVSADILVGLGNVFRKLGRIEDAQTAYARALELEPNGFGARCGQAIALSEADELQESLVAFDRLVEQFPRAHLAFFNRAILLAKLARHGDAACDLRDALAIEPEDFDTLYNLGVCLLHLEQNDVAKDILIRAVQRNPHDLRGLQNLGAAYSRLGQHDRAIEGKRFFGPTYHRSLLARMMPIPKGMTHARFHKPQG